jgi:hypothetical protein
MEWFGNKCSLRKWNLQKILFSLAKSVHKLSVFCLVSYQLLLGEHVDTFKLKSAIINSLKKLLSRTLWKYISLVLWVSYISSYVFQNFLSYLLLTLYLSKSSVHFLIHRHLVAILLKIAGFFLNICFKITYTLFCYFTEMPEHEIIFYTNLPHCFFVYAK